MSEDGDTTEPLPAPVEDQPRTDAALTVDRNEASQPTDQNAETGFALREFDVLDDINAEIAARLPALLKTWEGALLARFDWRLRGSGQVAGRLDVTLSSVVPSTRAGGGLPRLELTCTSRSGTAATVPIQLQTYRRKAAGLHFRTLVYGAWRDWECASLDEGMPNWNGTFPRPKGLPSLEQLAEVWLSSHAAKKGPESSVATGVECIGAPMRHKSLSDIWPQHEPASRRTDFTLARPLFDGGDPSAVSVERFAASILAFSVWGLLLRSLTVQDEPQPFDALVGTDVGGLPPADAYLPRRPVDLDPAKVRDRLQQEGLVIPWHVVEASCAALNSGKHVLFTGPPGCGKSKLAGVLAGLATGREPLMATASPAWTSGDLIGRYFPSRTRVGLEFRPGFFLRALAEGNRWLVIDEFNRANIDECFGELFSVLADDVVELPFEEELVDAGVAVGSDADTRVARVRIVPPRRGRKHVESSTGGVTSDYAVGPAFRFIGTMNDADRASLHQLSFALLRRFHIIRVEAPSSADVRRIMRAAVEACAQDLRLHDTAYRLVRRGRRMTSFSLSLDAVIDPLVALFARESATRNDQYSDLVRERVIGLASVLDLIRFVGEGLRGPAMPGRERCDVLIESEVGTLEDHARATTLSFLALGVVLSVFPQLDALSPADRSRAVRHILSVFRESGGAPVLMRRIEATDGHADAAFRMVCVRHAEPAEHDADQDGFVSIGEFLAEELCQQYRGTAEAEQFRGDLAGQADRED